MPWQPDLPGIDREGEKKAWDECLYDLPYFPPKRQALRGRGLHPRAGTPTFLPGPLLDRCRIYVASRRPALFHPDDSIHENMGPEGS